MLYTFTQHLLILFYRPFTSSHFIQSIIHSFPFLHLSSTPIHLALLGFVGGFRSFISPHTTSTETVAIVVALVLIVFISVVLGSTLPLMLQAIKVDPAHSSTSIQVIMDILGVIITCTVALSILYGSSTDTNAATDASDVNIQDIVGADGTGMVGSESGNGDTD